MAEIWSDIEIDGHPVVAEYIAEEAQVPSITKSEAWKYEHVRESQYFLQIVKCTSSTCCQPFESNCLKVVKDRFLPPPLPLQSCKFNGLVRAKDDKDGVYLSLLR